MAKVTRVSLPLKPPAPRPRVAAYARVSMESEQLLHSLSAQVSYYSNLIQGNPGWEFAGVYVDRGISGTQLRGREEFQRMLEDCEAGKINIVLTKSVSRFARNTVDLLSTVRRLKELGVEVRFEKEHISTLSTDGELMLSIVASFAQEESRSTSENVKWHVRKNYARGIDPACRRVVLGYRYDGEKYIVQPEEAEIVRYMFQRTRDGAQPADVAREMNERGWRSCAGNEFTRATVVQHLKNEIYIGDLLRQKSYTLDPITHHRVLNKGELPKYYMEGCHEPIIEKEVFREVQDILNQLPFKDDPFFGRVICGSCGCAYTRLRSHNSGKQYDYWICGQRKGKRYTCKSQRIPEDRLMRTCASMLGEASFNRDTFRKRIRRVVVQPNGDLDFEFKTGTHRLWKNVYQHPKASGVTISQCFDGLIWCENCGRDYTRACVGKYCYWFCHGGAKTNCYAPRIPDNRLRMITAIVLGQDKLDDSTVAKEIRAIYVTKEGNLRYCFHSGKETTWREE